MSNPDKLRAACEKAATQISGKYAGTLQYGKVRKECADLIEAAVRPVVEGMDEFRVRVRPHPSGKGNGCIATGCENLVPYFNGSDYCENCIRGDDA